MSFFVDDFFDELDKGSLTDATLLAEKWDEIFLRKELVKNAEFFEVKKPSESNPAAEQDAVSCGEAPSDERNATEKADSSESDSAVEPNPAGENRPENEADGSSGEAPSDERNAAEKTDSSESESTVETNPTGENRPENEADGSSREAGDMSDIDLKIAVAATVKDEALKLISGLARGRMDTALDLFRILKGKDACAFKSGDAIIAVSGTEEDNIEISYKKGEANLLFYFNGDDLEIDEVDDETDDEYDTGIYIFQKFYMALKIGGKTEIEFRRIRKKDRHAIQQNDVTLTEFLGRFAPYYGYTDFPENFAEHALRFMQRFLRIAHTERRKKYTAEREMAEAERERTEEKDLQRKEELLAKI